MRPGWLSFAQASVTSISGWLWDTCDLPGLSDPLRALWIGATVLLFKVVAEMYVQQCGRIGGRVWVLTSMSKAAMVLMWTPSAHLWGHPVLLLRTESLKAQR